MKRAISLILALALVCTLLPGLTVGTKAAGTWYTSGTGAEGDPYIISTYDQLNAFAAGVNSSIATKGMYIRLADGFGTGKSKTTALTQPIGADNDHAFKGHFDGNGQTVTLAIGSEAEPADYENAGMFGRVNKGSIENVTVDGAIFVASVDAKDSHVGGLVGRSFIALNGCASAVNVTVAGLGSIEVGSLVGYQNDLLSDCTATGSVTVTATETDRLYVGGLAGYVKGSTKGLSSINCLATGKVKATVTLKAAASAAYVGGLTGEASMQVINCIATGDVEASISASTAETYEHIGVGGVLGCLDDDSDFIANCYSVGTVTAAEGTPFAGATLQLSNNIGGVKGNDMTGAPCKNCYYKKADGLKGIGGTDDVEGSTASMTDENMKAAVSESTSLAYKLNDYLTKNTIGSAKLWKVKAGVNGGYPIFMDVPYLDETGKTQFCSDYTVLATSTDPEKTHSWTNQTFVVYKDTSIDGKVFFSNKANLILMDGATLTLSKIEAVAGKEIKNASLTVYGQKIGSGELKAESAASIEGVENFSLTICGGNVNVTSETDNAIKTNSVAVNGGTLVAMGAESKNAFDGSTTVTAPLTATVRTGTDSGSASVVDRSDETVDVSNARYVSIGLPAPIVFDDGFDTPDCAFDTYTVGKDYMMGDPEKDIYRFEGWYLNGDIEKPLTSAENAKSGDYYVAKWRAGAPVNTISDLDTEELAFPCALNLNNESTDYTVEAVENGFVVKYKDTYVKLDGSRKVVSAESRDDATVWKYDGGLYRLVASNSRYTGWFHTPRMTRYYLTVDDAGSLCVSLKSAAAKAEYETRITFDVPTLTYTDALTPVLWFQRHTNAFEIGSVPDGTSVAYSLGYKWSVGNTFSVRYLPETIQIRVTAEDGTVTQWQAKLVDGAYEVSLVK